MIITDGGVVKRIATFNTSNVYRESDVGYPESQGYGGEYTRGALMGGSLILLLAV